MFVNISPLESNMAETVSSLEFGDKLNWEKLLIKTGYKGIILMIINIHTNNVLLIA